MHGHMKSNNSFPYFVTLELPFRQYAVLFSSEVSEVHF